MSYVCQDITYQNNIYIYICKNAVSKERYEAQAITNNLLILMGQFVNLILAIRFISILINIIISAVIVVIITDTLIKVTVADYSVYDTPTYAKSTQCG